MASSDFSRKLPQRLVLGCGQLAVAIAIASLIAVIKIKADAGTQPTAATGSYVFAADIDGTMHYITSLQDTLLMLAVPGLWAGMLATFILAIAYSSLRRREIERAGK